MAYILNIQQGSTVIYKEKYFKGDLLMGSHDYHTQTYEKLP